MPLENKTLAGGPGAQTLGLTAFAQSSILNIARVMSGLWQQPPAVKV